MIEFKTVVESCYEDYIKFDNAVKKENQKFQDKGKFFKSEDKKGVDTLLEKGEDLKNLYVDTTIANSQLRMKFENLIFLIRLYLETGKEDLSEQINNFYKEFSKYKTKNVFTVEKEELVPTDEELLQEARRQVSESPLFKILKQN